MDEEALFVVGNTLFTIYHELGHGLIDMLDLPVIGREEDAVDGFAAVTMIPDAPDAMRDALIVAVADGWRIQSARISDSDPRPYWGVHALDEQRYFQIVCLMVGSDQDGFYDFALESELPERRIKTCSRDFTSMKTGWNRLLAPYRPAVQEELPSIEAPITLTFEPPPPEQLFLLDLLEQGQLMEQAISRFADSVTLPKPITIRFTSCESNNAYWSPDRQEVIVCYELVEAFNGMLRG